MARDGVSHTGREVLGDGVIDVLQVPGRRGEGVAREGRGHGAGVARVDVVGVDPGGIGDYGPSAAEGDTDTGQGRGGGADGSGDPDPVGGGEVLTGLIKRRSREGAQDGGGVEARREDREGAGIGRRNREGVVARGIGRGDLARAEGNRGTRDGRAGVPGDPAGDDDDRRGVEVLGGHVRGKGRVGVCGGRVGVVRGGGPDGAGEGAPQVQAVVPAGIREQRLAITGGDDDAREGHAAVGDSSGDGGDGDTDGDDVAGRRIARLVIGADAVFELRASRHSQVTEAPDIGNHGGDGGEGGGAKDPALDGEAGLVSRVVKPLEVGAGGLAEQDRQP